MQSALTSVPAPSRLERPLPPWPFFEADEIKAVTAVLESGKVNYWTGQECQNFEKEYAAALGVKHVIAAANGTVTLEMALKALGLGPGDEVVVSPRSFVASTSCVVNCGARPIFADVERESGNISAATVAPVITPRTKAIIPVHLAGWPCEMDALVPLAAKHNLAIIEDAAQAHGAAYQNRPVGTWGIVGSFSFCQDKIITTGGEGGLLATNDTALWERLWSLKEHGKSYEACFKRQWPPGFRWLHESFGSNYRMTEMQAAIGRLALRKLPGWVGQRARNAAQLSAVLRQFPFLRDPAPPAHVRHAHYKHYCYVRPEALRAGWSRDRIMQEISARGVPCFSGSCSEIYREKACVDRGFVPPAPLPVARELGETSLLFLVHPTITAEHQERVCAIVGDVLAQAGN